MQVFNVYLKFCTIIRFLHFKANLKRDLVLSVTGIVVAHPFHVISIRMMAQFIGREKLYNSIVGSILEIYRNDGIQGFFAGIAPKLISDLMCLVLTSTTVYMINKYFIKDKTGRQYCAGFTQVNHRFSSKKKTKMNKNEQKGIFNFSP